MVSQAREFSQKGVPQKILQGQNEMQMCVNIRIWNRKEMETQIDHLAEQDVYTHFESPMNVPYTIYVTWRNNYILTSIQNK